MDSVEGFHTYTASQAFDLATWYALEMWFKKDTAGGCTLRVNDTVILTADCTTNPYDVTALSLKESLNVGGAKTQYFDCAVIDSAHIGLDEISGPTVKKGSCVPAMTALLTKFSALKQPRQPRFQPRTFPKFTPRILI